MKYAKPILKFVAVTAAIVATSTAEYDLGRAIGMNWFVAGAVPGALDAYVLRALIARREVLVSVLAMVGVNAASHLMAKGHVPLDWPLITAVSAIAPLVLWRLHALGTTSTLRWPMSTRAQGTSTEHGRVPDDVPVPEPVPGHPERVRTESPLGYELRAPSTCEHGPYEVCPLCSETCSWCGWAECPTGHMEGHKRDACSERFEHRGASTDDDLDVPEFMKEHVAETRRVLDTVSVPDDIGALWGRSPIVRVPDEHTSTPFVLHAVPPLPPLPDEWARRSTDPSTREARDHAYVLCDGHVSEGRLLPYDTEFMEQARTCSPLTLRGMKEHTSTGTDRARRLLAAVKHEQEHADTSTPSTDGDAS